MKREGPVMITFNLTRVTEVTQHLQRLMTAPTPSAGKPCMRRAMGSWGKVCS